ncbi:hypothetical protein ACFLTB_03690 [Chloroflexota bacterium]
MLEIIRDTLLKVKAFEDEAHRLLAKHETTRSRVITLDDTYNHLGGMTLQQDALFREALRCIENQLFRAAYVMAWAGFMDYLEVKLMSEYLKDIKAEYPKWSVNNVEELREKVPEYQIVVACRKVKLLSKNEEKALLGLLSTRNECAHPSNYIPDLNEALGYISQLLNRISTLQKKSHP